jgi:Zn-dependent protease
MHTLLDIAFRNPLEYATIVFVIVGSIVLHELGHALAATWEGDSTPRMLGHLTWNPVVHMGWISLALVAVMGIGWGQTPVNRRAFRHRRWGQVLVSGAGPVVNVFLAVVGAFVGVLAAKNGAGDGFVHFWETVLRFNVLLFLFNLVPLPPLDGFSVVDGMVDLGELGAQIKRAGMIAFIVAILIVNSDAFDRVWMAVTKALIRLAQSAVGAG